MMLEQLSFTVLIVLVFGGVIFAIARFTLTGKTRADLSQRMNISRFEKVMGTPYKKEIGKKVEFELPEVKVRKEGTSRV